MSQASVRDGTIGVLLKTYPKLSETFILNELLGLERQGLKLHVFSLQRPTDHVFQANAAKLRAPVSYVPDLSWVNWLPAAKVHLDLLRRRPFGYAKAIGFLLRRPETGRWRDFVQAGGLAAELKEAGIGHLYTHFINRPAGVAELVNIMTGVSYSISAHAKDIYLSPPPVLERKLARARFAATCTEYNRRHLAQISPPQTAIVRLYHGIDLQQFRPDDTVRRSRPALILSVGRLREKKGFATLISACAALHRAGLALQCRIVGYGPDQVQLEQQIRAADLEGIVELAGPLTHEALINLYRQATLFVLPCRIGADGDRDGIPNVLLEAMALELPVVSTNVSGIPEVIAHDRSGLLVAPENPPALATAMRRIIENSQLAARLGQAGRKTVARHFTNDSNLKRLRDLLLATHFAGAENSPAPLAEEQLYG